MTSHLVTVKKANMTIPGRGVVPINTQLIVSERKYERFSGRSFSVAGNLQYDGPGLATRIQTLTGAVAASVLGASAVMGSAGRLVGYGVLFTAPITTGAGNLVLGASVVGSAVSAYTAPTATARIAVTGLTAAEAAWAPLRVGIPFKAGQKIQFNCVTHATAVTGIGVLVLVLEDAEGNFATYS